jgi:hypothetical protein
MRLNCHSVCVSGVMRMVAIGVLQGEDLTRGYSSQLLSCNLLQFDQ